FSRDWSSDVCSSDLYAYRVKLMLFPDAFFPNISYTSFKRIDGIKLLPCKDIIAQLEIGTGHIPSPGIDLNKRNDKPRNTQIGFCTKPVCIKARCLAAELYFKTCAGVNG